MASDGMRWHGIASDGIGWRGWHGMGWHGMEWHGIASDGIGWHRMARIKRQKIDKGGLSFKTLNCNPVTDLSNVSQTLYWSESHDIKVIYSKTTCSEVGRIYG